MDDFARLQAFVEAAPTITSADALAEAVVTVSSPLGFPTIMCGAVRVRGNSVAAHFYFGNWPTQWTRNYIESLMPQDPIVLEARRRIVPFTWTEVSAEGEYGERWQSLLEMARPYGWTNGFAVPIHGPAGYVGLASFAGNAASVSPSEHAILVALAHAGHHRGRRLYRESSAPEQPQLTKREHQVMRWVAHGKTDSEIATILSISPATAHDYVEQAKRKLGVRSRSQAVSELALYDLL